MKIFIDHREKKILNLVQEIEPEAEVTTLPVGDLLLDTGEDGVLLERKSVPDLVSSIRSNRLWEQLLALLKTEKVCDLEIRRRMLVIHGDLATYVSGDNWRFWSSLAGALQEILFVYDTPIVFVGDDSFFSQFLRILIKREREGANDGVPKARWQQKGRVSLLPLKDPQVFLLGSIPGVGDVLALNLLECFGTIANIAIASIDELGVVEGIGPVKAGLIYELFHREFK